MLFGKKRFSPKLYAPVDPLINGKFLVESRSNDDVGDIKFIDNVRDRFARAGAKVKKADLIAAFCPTRGPQNDCIRILQSKPFSKFDEIHVLLLQYKWDWHAELRLAEVESYLKQDSRVRTFVIDQDKAFTADPDRLTARDDAIRRHLHSIYP
ncbi:hypothetical protein G7091_19195 [Rubrivivax benzoatilyticus]|nr:hypothetical protein [Rubrivivax benzoatilyticus]NHL26372.1 hypothetical protein [Rubrivivax benzoatilyticus]